jgi:hypothetical protein
MPEKLIKRAPISQAPTKTLVAQWERSLRLMDEVIDKEFAISLLSEALIAKAICAQSAGVVLPIDAALAEQRYLKLKKSVGEIYQAVSAVRQREYGLRLRDGDFDIIEPQAGMNGLFIPLAVGAVIVAGCFFTLYHLGEDASKLVIEYKKLNKAADSVLCSDPKSDLCKNWNVVKEAQKIEEKESFADSLMGGVSKGLSIGLAVAVGLLALSFIRR